MKTMKKILMFVMVLSMVVTAVPSTVEVKAKTYKTKTVKITWGYSTDKKKLNYKTVKMKSKIKKVKMYPKDNKDSYGWSGKKLFIYGDEELKARTLKVTYTNGRTQKVKVKVVLPAYAQKIVKELKPLLANPDEGLKKAINDWCKVKSKSTGEKYVLRNSVSECTSEDGSGIYDVMLTERCNGHARSITLDDLDTYTSSQKKVFILQLYFTARMNYDASLINDFSCYRNESNRNKYFKKLYKGTFKGICDSGALAGYDICRFLGIEARNIISLDKNHSWLVVKTKDSSGKSYWAGVYTTSTATSLKNSLPKQYDCGREQNAPTSKKSKKNLTMKNLKKYQYDTAPEIRMSVIE